MSSAHIADIRLNGLSVPEAGVNAAVAGTFRVPVVLVTAPIELDVRFKNYRPAEVLAYLPNIERIDAHTIRFRAKDIGEVTRFLEFIDNYEPGLAP